MTNQEIESLIKDALVCNEVSVNGDGSHFEARVVSSDFEGKRPVQRQQAVYATLNQHIASGAIHALTIKAFTPQEWEKAKKLQIGSL
ncbi:MAG: BolA family protein [Pseudomonadota bacterium]